jgi:hypothetical protein
MGVFSWYLNLGRQMRNKRIHTNKTKTVVKNSKVTSHHAGRYLVTPSATGRYYILRQYSNIFFNSIAEFEAWFSAAAASEYADNPTIVPGSSVDAQGNHVSTRAFYTWDDNSYVTTWAETVYSEVTALCNSGVPASYNASNGTWYCLIGS